MDFIHQNITRKLVLISAAAGYGKTSLVVDFARDTDFPVAWLNLEESDQDLGTLLGGLLASLRNVFPGSCGTAEALLAGGPAASAQPEQLAAALASDLEQLPGQYFIICLDDYHMVATAEAVGRFVTRLINLLPEQAHLIVTSRSIPPPPFPIVPLAARQEIAGLNEEQLRFSSAEIQALMQLRNQVAMPEAEAERLAADSEGWITGILLTSHLMWQGLMAAWLRAQQAGAPVYDYLAEEVMAGLDPNLRQFLYESSVLPEMDAATCDEVLGRTDSEAMLERAELQRLFISSVGEEARSFRYHQLFRDFLLTKLKSSAPDRLHELQLGAAQWYEARGWPEAALTFYLAAGDVQRAAAIAESSARSLFMAGRHETLQQWGQQLQDAHGRAPRLQLYLSKVHTDAGNLSAAAAALDLATTVFRECDDQEGSVAAAVQASILAYRRAEYAKALHLSQTAAEMATRHNLWELAAQANRYEGLCNFALGQLAAAEAALAGAADFLERSGQRFDLALTQHDLARVYKAGGKTARAVKAQQSALGIWREHGDLGPLSMALNNIGWDKHMLGHYDEALATYTEALELARRAGSSRVEILVLAGQGDLLAELGDLRQAAEFYRRAIELAEVMNEAGFLGYLYRANARLDRWGGNYAGALEWLRRSELAPASSQAESPGTNTACLRAALWLEMGRVNEASAVLEQECAKLQEAGAIVDLSSALFCLARARLATGLSDAAFEALGQAFELAEQVGYDQMLVAEAPAASDLLTAARTHPTLSLRAAGLANRAKTSREVLAHLRSNGAPAARQRRAVLEIQALGKSQVLRNEEEISRAAWASQQPRELFLFLVDNAPVRREAILEVFWKNKTAARAAANLHQALYQARRAIGHEAVVVRDGRYELAGNLDLDYDVARFERAARSAQALPAGDPRRTSALAAALELYTGDYLADLPTDWAQRRRQALADLHLELMRQQAEELIGQIRWPEARNILARAIEIDPLSDDLNGLMLRCLASMGRRHEIVEHYQIYRERLRTELGIDPPQGTRELYGRLLQ